MHTKADIEKLAEDFKNCQKVLAALGDENRQHLILEMMKMGKCSGARGGYYRKNTSFTSGSIPSSSNFEGCRNPESEERSNQKLLLF